MGGTGSSRLLLTSASSEGFQLADCRVGNLSRLREDFLSSEFLHDALEVCHEPQGFVGHSFV